MFFFYFCFITTKDNPSSELSVSDASCNAVSQSETHDTASVQQHYTTTTHTKLDKIAPKPQLASSTINLNCMSSKIAPTSTTTMTVQSSNYVLHDEKLQPQQQQPMAISEAVEIGAAVALSSGTMKISIFIKIIIAVLMPIACKNTKSI